MQTNREIIEEIIEDLESTVGLIWPTSPKVRVTRTALIECWSKYRKEPDASFYGYTNTSSASRPYKSIFNNIVKDYKESWKTYILRLYNYKYCYKCVELKPIDSFTTRKVSVSNLNPTCKECDNAQRQQYYKDHRDQELANRVEYQNVHKTRLAVYRKEYNKNNRDKKNTYEAKRRAAKINRTPLWLTEEDRWMFKEVYSLSKLREELTGIKYNVDHIIPLQGKLVSGLHVPSNLQVIPAKDNFEKSNKYTIN